MDKEAFRGRWEEMRSEVKTQWGKLTEYEVEDIRGDIDRLRVTLQNRYAYSREQAKDVLDNFLKRFDP